MALVSSKFIKIQCTKELAGVVYQPKTQKYFYLEQISQVLIAQKPLLFGIQAQQNQVLNNFVHEFEVFVVVSDAFGSSTTYASSGIFPPPPSPISIGQMRAAALNQPVYFVYEGEDYYTFILFDDIAIMKYFTIILPDNGRIG